MGSHDDLITRQGYEQLADELRQLWQQQRPEITAKVTWAAGLGDRSENADYQYNKQLLRKIDRRIRYLSRRMEQLRIVDYSPEQAGKVYFGASVEIENDSGECVQLRIVGIDEIFDQQGRVSIRAPIARAMLGKTVDDEFEVHTPQGKVSWWINRIWYDTAESSS